MAICPVKSILGTWKALAEVQFEDPTLFRSLGVCNQDQLKIMRELAQSIASGKLVTEYCPSEQKVLFQAGERTVAIFKPGSYRLDIELAVNDLLTLMGARNVCPSMAMAFDFKTIEPLRRENFEDLGMSGQCSFASEYHPNGYSTYYVACPLEDSRKKSALVQPKGTLAGILNSYLPDKEVSIEAFSESIVIGAATGMRDFQALKAGAIFDLEEAMAANPGPGKDLSPHLHMPILGDKRTIEELPKDVLDKLRKTVLSWDVDKLVLFAKERKFSFRQRELEEEIGQRKYRKGSRLIRMTKHEAEYFSEASERERDFFPVISTDQEFLFTDSQCTAFRDRLERIQSFFRKFKEDPAEWPKVNLWGLVHVIDPIHKEYSFRVCEMRAQVLRRNHKFSIAEIRTFSLDACEEMFRESLAVHAGRTPLKISKKEPGGAAALKEQEPKVALEFEDAYFSPEEVCQRAIEGLEIRT